MGLDDIRAGGAAGFDGVRVDGSLPQDPSAIEKMAGAQDAVLNRNELFADDVALFLGIADAFERAQEFAGGVFHMKCFGTELFEQAADVGGFALAHQAGVDINPVNAFGAERSEAESVGDGRIHAAAHEEENVAIAGDRPDLCFQRADAVFGIPVLHASTDAENEIGQNLRPRVVWTTSGWNWTPRAAGVAMGHGRDGASSVPARISKPGGTRFHLVAMIHPNLRIAVQALEQLVRFDGLEHRQAVLAFVAFSHMAAQIVRHELLAVTDAEHGAA